MKEAMKDLEFLSQDGLGLSQDWFPDSVQIVKDLRKKTLKSSFELMKVKKLLFDGKKGKIKFEFDGKENKLHTLSIDLLS